MQLPKINFRAFWTASFLNKVVLGIVVGLLIFGFFSVKACLNRPTRAAYQAGIADGSKAQYLTDMKAMAKDHAAVVAEKDVLQKAVAGTNAENARLKKIINGNTVVATDLEAARKLLTDKDAIIANLDQQVAIHKTNEATWEDRFNNEHGLRLKLEGDYSDLTKKYEALWNHDLAGAKALEDMTKSRDLYKKTASTNKTYAYIGGGIALVFAGKTVYDLLHK